MQVSIRMRWQMAMLAAVLVAGAVGFASAPAEARRTRGFKGETDLTATSVDPDARGKVKASAKNDDGRFEVSASKLDRKATYEVIVGGVKVATFTTGGGGSGKARLRTNPRGRDALLGFDPRGADVVVRNAAGNDVLFGAVPATSAGDDPSEIVCCVPDDGGTECEDRTADECTAKGGTVSTATSCVPNPCAGSTPPAGGEIVCCVPDDGGAECEDRTTDACVAEGGTVVAATSCDPNPCAVTPPADPGVVCCLPDDSGPECEDRTSAECAAQGGVDLGAGVCAPDSCAGVTFSGSGEPGDDNGGVNEPGDDNGGGGEGGDDHGSR